MINLISIMLALLGVGILYYTRKMQEKDKPKYIVVTQYVAMALIIIMSAYSQYESSKNDEAYKNAVHEIAVLSKVSEYFLPVMNDMKNIQNSMLSVKNYLSFERAKIEHPDFASAINWEGVAAESHLQELQSARDSFERIKLVAAEVVKLNIEYESVLPNVTLGWASLTLNMKFSEIEEYFDPYAPVGKLPKETVIAYHENTGKAFGEVIGRVRVASDVIKGN